MSSINDFFSSLKDDLLNRRMLPFLVVLGVALVGAVAYAVLSGGSSTTSTVSVSASSGGSPVVAGVAVSQAPANPDRPISETTNGASKQHEGYARNPFIPLPGAGTTSAGAASTVPSTTSTTPSSPSGSGTSTSSAGGATPAPAPAPEPKAPAKPAPPEPVYHVLALFGLAPVAPALSSTLRPYENIKRLTPLPATTPLVVFMGVTAGGKSATFTLVGEAILHGNGACLPSASQCQAIDLRPGQVEQLEYLPPNGQTIVYELKVLSISASKASAAAAQRSYRVQSRAGREALRHSGVPALTEMHYSPNKGVLVFAGHSAFAARAHGARAHAAKRRHRR